MRFKPSFEIRVEYARYTDFRYDEMIEAVNFLFDYIHVVFVSYVY